ncbi:MAG: J domain-containing protein [Myxococcota bacterium]
MAAIPEQGTFEQTPLPRLLLAVYRAGFNGTLRLVRERAEKTVKLQQGVPIFAESNLASETLGVQLMDAGLIRREDHLRVSKHMEEKGCREGTALLDLGLIDPRSLFIALKDQVRARLLDCFGWPQGSFRVEGSGAPDEKAQPFRVDVYRLVQEGIETHWSHDRILADLAPHMETCVRRTRQLSRIQERLVWDDAVQDFIDALDGTRTLWRALQSARTPRALAAAWLLDATGAMEYPENLEVLDTEAEPEIEIVLRDTVAPVQDTARPVDDKPDDGVDEVLVAEIDDKFARLAELDHYELLELASNASTDEIRKAYLGAAKRYHPDALARAGVDEETRQRAGKVFGAIGTAHAVLSNPNRRRDYDARLGSDESDLDAERLAAAETNFRKAEILLRTGNFRGAVEYLRPAVELWPEEPAYQAALGWALFKKMPPEPEDARRHLERAYELDASDAQTMFWLGTVLKAAGEAVAASNLLAKAQKLDPSLG